MTLPNLNPGKPALTRRRRAETHGLAPYLFVLPFVLGFLTFTLYPLTRSLILSFYKTNGATHSRFVDIQNYTFILRDRLFWGAVLNTVSYTVVFLSIQIPAALGLAMLLNNPKIKFRNLFRFAFFSTHLVGSVFAAVLFSQVLSTRGGLLNRGLSFFSGHDVQINWLGTPDLAMPAVMMAALWLSIGYAMIYFLAALQSVDRELYEAADVDGAGKWAQFRHITLPGVRPVMMFLIVVGTIGSLQLFELPFVLFQQGAGPNSRALTIVMYLYLFGFELRDLGYASAVGWVLVVMIFGLSLLQLKISKTGAES